VLFENDVRVLEVTMTAGQREPPLEPVVKGDSV
jgi:hypothetical protein